MRRMVKVNSSFIAAIGYDADTRVLTVRHKGKGGTFRYKNVGPGVHEAMMESRSKGQFFNDRIRGVYPELK